MSAPVMTDDRGGGLGERFLRLRDRRDRRRRVAAPDGGHETDESRRVEEVGLKVRVGREQPAERGLRLGHVVLDEKMRARSASARLRSARVGFASRHGSVAWRASSNFPWVKRSDAVLSDVSHVSCANPDAGVRTRTAPTATANMAARDMTPRFIVCSRSARLPGNTPSGAGCHRTCIRATPAWSVFVSRAGRSPRRAGRPASARIASCDRRRPTRAAVRGRRSPPPRPSRYGRSARWVRVPGDRRPTGAGCRRGSLRRAARLNRESQRRHRRSVTGQLGGRALESPGHEQDRSFFGAGREAAVGRERQRANRPVAEDPPRRVIGTLGVPDEGAAAAGWIRPAGRPAGTPGTRSASRRRS